MAVKRAKRANTRCRWQPNLNGNKLHAKIFCAFVTKKFYVLNKIALICKVGTLDIFKIMISLVCSRVRFGICLCVNEKPHASSEILNCSCTLICIDTYMYVCIHVYKHMNICIHTYVHNKCKFNFMKYFRHPFDKTAKTTNLKN